MRISRYRPLSQSRQQRIEFTRDGPRFPAETVREYQGLLTQLIVEIFRGKSGQRSPDERQDQT